MPAVAVGARDILGTGAWEAEYVVASKGGAALMYRLAWAGADWVPALGFRTRWA